LGVAQGAKDFSSERKLTCNQTSTDVITFWNDHEDSRGRMPMFGYPDLN